MRVPRRLAEGEAEHVHGGADRRGLRRGDEGRGGGGAIDGEQHQIGGHEHPGNLRRAFVLALVADADTGAAGDHMQIRDHEAGLGPGEAGAGAGGFVAAAAIGHHAQDGRGDFGEGGGGGLLCGRLRGGGTGRHREAGEAPQPHRFFSPACRASSWFEAAWAAAAMPA